MRVDAVRFAVSDIHVTAIGLPSRLASSEMLVRIGDAAIVLFAELILRRVGIRIAAQPEVLNKGFPLFIVRQAFERLHLLIGDDPAHVLVEPLLIGAFQLLLQFLLLLEFLFIAKRPVERVLRRLFDIAASIWGCGLLAVQGGKEDESTGGQGKKADNAMTNRIHRFLWTPNQCRYSIVP